MSVSTTPCEANGPMLCTVIVSVAGLDCWTGLDGPEMLTARSATPAMVMVRLWVAVCVALSATCTENVNVPGAVGVPLMVPVDESIDNPSGRVPELTDQV